MPPPTITNSACTCRPLSSSRGRQYTSRPHARARTRGSLYCGRGHALPLRSEHRARRDHPGAALYGSRLPRTGTGARLRPHVATGRPHRGRDPERAVLHHRDRRRGHRRGARRRHVAGVPQRLPAPRRPGGIRVRKPPDAAVQVSRLDLSARRVAAPHAGHGGRTQLRRRRDASRAAAGRGLGAAGVRQSRPQGAAARALPRGPAGQGRLRFEPDLLVHRAARIRRGVQLEGLRRQLPRGVSHPARPPDAAQGAG